MDTDAEGISTKYDLYGVVNHFGSLNGGHYTAHCKNPDGNWYNFNDYSVSGAPANSIVSSSAYVLFYRRREEFTPSTQASEGSSKKEDDYIYELD